MFKDIEGIKYDGGPAGRAFGGGIYGANCQVGFSNTSTKISLNIVAESSDDYTISEDDLNVTDSGAHTIQVGDVKFHRMYLYSYNFNNTPNSKTLTVHFVDQSICLDKIFVGLTARHGTMTNQIINEGQWYNPSNTVQVTAISETFVFRIMCLECNSLRPSKMMHPPSTDPPHSVTRLVYVAGDGNPGPVPYGCYVNVERGAACVNGGYILLGKEGFTETNCEIPKVEYTFEDLCNVLDYILGGDPLGFSGAPSYKHNLRDFKRSSTYAASYTGSLREVLSAWAADFSFDFTFDYSQEDLFIQAIDLEKAVDLTDIKNAISSGFGPDSKDLNANPVKKGALIRNHTESHSLENTYKQSPLVKFIKPPRPFQRTQKNYQEAVGKIISVADAIGTSAHLGRTDHEMLVSQALAKYSPESRIIWLSDLARKKWEDRSWVNPLNPDPAFDPTKHTSNNDIKLRRDMPWMALGFFPAMGFNTTQEDVNAGRATAAQLAEDTKKKEDILVHFGVIPTNKQTTHPIYDSPENYSVYVGIWNEEYQDKVGEFDREIANDFLGKYAYWWGNRSTADQAAEGIFNYGPVDPPPDERQCPKFTFHLEGNQQHAAYYYENDVSTLPNSKAYKGHSYPFDNILRANGGFFAVPPGVNDTDPCTYCPERTIFEIADNAWGTAPEEVEKMLRNKYIMDLDDAPAFYEDAGVLSDLQLYIPYYARIGAYDERTLGAFFTDIIGISNWKETIIKPEYMKDGYHPGIAIIPHMDKMKIDVKDDSNPPVVTKDVPVLEVDYSAWGACCGDTPVAPSTATIDPWVSGRTWGENDHTVYDKRCYKFDDWEHDGKKAYEIYNSDKDAVDVLYNTQDPDVAIHFDTAKPFFVGCGSDVFNAMVYQNTQRRAKESIKGDPNECILLCEEDIVDAVCRCDSIEEPIHRFQNYTSKVLYIRHMGMEVPIVFPVNSNYKGYWISDQKEKGYYPSKRIVMGEPPLPSDLKAANGGRGVMETRIVDMDVTQDLESLEVDSRGKYVEHLVVENTLVNPPIKEVVTLPQFYTFMQAITQSADSTNESIDVRVDGTEFDTLTQYMKPSFGLSAFNVTLDTEGITTDLTFVTRPKKLPKRDVLLQKIGPRAIEGRIPKPQVNVDRGWNVEDKNEI
tara:strand:- start:3355 stop:6780 length:3426 start_codon:yes stop_codon:yes gene_type:complete